METEKSKRGWEQPDGPFFCWIKVSVKLPDAERKA